MRKTPQINTLKLWNIWYSAKNENDVRLCGNKTDLRVTKKKLLTGEANDRAHSSLWTRSPGFGTRIVDKTDIKISPTSPMTTSLDQPFRKKLARLGLGSRSTDNQTNKCVCCLALSEFAWMNHGMLPVFREGPKRAPAWYRNPWNINPQWFFLCRFNPFLFPDAKYC